MARAATAETSSDDGFPRPFGNYLLLENFARGGMGEVYLAKKGDIVGLEKYCVLKKLRSELTRDGEYVRRFIDEARVVVTLNHTNICQVFDVGRVGDEYYLAMEYISGRDVRTMQDRCVRKGKTIPVPVALHLVCEVLEALDYAHRRHHPHTGEHLNVVHRDVSPQNVLVSYEGEVKLIDFGLAASKLKVERTQPNVVMGKMAYMAPEQARGDPIDPRADLFACGVVLYELLSGERFYEDMSANDIWQVAGKGGFQPRRWAQMPPEIAHILSRALHPDPTKRFSTCGDFREALATQAQWMAAGATGSRGLREVMNDLFADEVAREREMLARFGRVSIMTFRTEFEESQSQSISLARADDTQTGSVRVTRNEQSTPSGEMPPPGAQGIHQEPTRIAAAEDTLVRRKERSTDEADDDKSPTVIRPEPRPEPRPDSRSRDQAEPTMRVARQPKPVAEGAATLFVEPRDDPPRSRLPLFAGLGAIAIAAASAIIVLNPLEESGASALAAKDAEAAVPPAASSMGQPVAVPVTSAPAAVPVAVPVAPPEAAVTAPPVATAAAPAPKPTPDENAATLPSQADTQPPIEPVSQEKNKVEKRKRVVRPKADDPPKADPPAKPDPPKVEAPPKTAMTLEAAKRQAPRYPRCSSILAKLTVSRNPSLEGELIACVSQEGK